MSTLDPYESLGVSPSATRQDITAAFRYLAKHYHPDRNPAGAKRMKELTEAYDRLMSQGREATQTSSSAAGQGRQQHASPRSQTETDDNPSAPRPAGCPTCDGPMPCQNCRVGQLEARVIGTGMSLAVAAAMWLLMFHGHFRGGLESLLLGLMPVGVTAWRRFKRTRVGAYIDGTLRPMGSPLEVIMRVVLRGLVLAIVTLVGGTAVLTHSVIELWVLRRRGASGRVWWIRRPSVWKRWKVA